MERTSQRDDGDGADKTGEGADLRDACAQTEGNRPVCSVSALARGRRTEDDHRRPDHAAALGHERRALEKALDDVDVDDLGADVAVEAGGEQARDESKDVADRLTAVRADALIGESEGKPAMLAKPCETLTHWPCSA